MASSSRLSVLLVLVFAAPLQAVSWEDYRPPEQGSVRIVRDAYGVPHIVARTENDLFFGVGYAQAEDQLENLVMNFLRAQGRAAEREGASALVFDHLMRMLRLPERAREHYAVLEPRYRQHLDAFAAGVNAYIEQHRDEVPSWIEPVRPEQVLAFSDYVEILFSVSHCRRDLERAGVRLGGLAMLDELEAEWVGSNQFAVRPARSASGAAMLSMDPHLPHSSFYRWYEMHLVSPEINCMGACFFGSPYVSMGRTARTAWCMTVNGPDLGDVFAFEIDPDNPDRVKGPHGWETVETSTTTHHVRGPSGVREATLPIRQTSLGPIVATKDGVAYVFALPLSSEPRRAGQIYNMARAQNVKEFREAIAPLGIVMFNLLYADASGDIFYISNGRIPKRDTRIASTDVRPAAEAWAQWQGFHTLDELPQVLNPPANFLMNTNSGPQNVCPSGAPQPEDFPPYMMSQQHNSRSLRLKQLLEADDSLTWEDMHDYATDTYLIGADELVPRIVSLLSQRADADAASAARLRQITEVLSAWDRRTDLESRGAVLFMYLVQDADFRKALEQNDAQALANQALQVAQAVEKRLAKLDAPWGEFSRIRRGDVELGIAGNGIRGPLSELKLTALRPTYGQLDDGRRYCTGGSSYAMIVDFAGPTRSISCLPFGVSEHADSPHFADQLPLYVKRQYKPAWFLPEEIAAHVESDRVLAVPPLEAP